MSMENYGQLKTALINLMHRSDIVPYIDEVGEVVSTEIASRIQLRDNQENLVLSDADRQSNDRRVYFIDDWIVANSFVTDIYLAKGNDVIGYDRALKRRHAISQLQHTELPIRRENLLEYFVYKSNPYVQFNIEPPEGTYFSVWFVVSEAPFVSDSDSNRLLINDPGLYFYCYAKHVSHYLQDAELTAIYTEAFEHHVRVANERTAHEQEEGPVTIQGASQWYC